MANKRSFKAPLDCVWPLDQSTLRSKCERAHSSELNLIDGCKKLERNEMFNCFRFGKGRGKNEFELSYAIRPSVDSLQLTS